MAFLDELGNILPGQQGGGWQAWLADPVNRAGLLSFGAQALTGTGGSFGSEMGAALAKGFEGASATDTAVRKQQELDEEQERRSAESAANRANQMEVARLAASSREEVARQRQAGMMEGIALRNQGAMDRTQVRAGGAGGAKGQLTDNQAIQRAQELLKNPMQFEQMPIEDRMQVLDLARRLKTEGLSGVAPAGAPTPAAPAAKGAPAPQAAGGGTPGGVTLETLQKSPALAPLLATKEGRDKIRAARPDLAHLLPKD